MKLSITEAVNYCSLDSANNFVFFRLGKAIIRAVLLINWEHKERMNWSINDSVNYGKLPEYYDGTKWQMTSKIMMNFEETNFYTSFEEVSLTNDTH